MDALTLVANPGSASRKYALFSRDILVADIHFEREKKAIIYTLRSGGKTLTKTANLSHISFAATLLPDLLTKHKLVADLKDVQKIALRIVAPSEYFQQHRVLDEEALKNLERLEPYAMIHIGSALQEIKLLERTLPSVPLVGVSDSAFHSTIPEQYANYGLPYEDAKKFGIRRYGYHGLSVDSVVAVLKRQKRLPKRLIVCHLGSGSSVTAVKNGTSTNTTMGFSPLEGLLMATRSGSFDPEIVEVLQSGLGLKALKLQDYLNNKSGLLGVSGVSSDIRELLESESAGNERARLALDMYVARAQMAIGQMMTVLNGCDALVFTGTVGERSAEIRKRIVSRLLFSGFSLDSHQNHAQTNPEKPVVISPADHPAKVFVIPTEENAVIAARAHKI